MGYVLGHGSLRQCAEDALDSPVIAAIAEDVLGNLPLAYSLGGKRANALALLRR